jgi:FAD/FMN-containing dehydrogenase
MTLQYPSAPTLAPSIRRTDILDLEANLVGELIRPAHDDYDLARRVRNLSFDRHPSLIARAADAADVIRAVTFARDHQLPLAVRSGGHSLAGHSTVDGGLVLDLSRMRGLSIDPERRIAWAQPGLTWGDYAGAAQAYGLATSAGDTSTVGVGGLTLGGGIGWMVRKHGLTVDNLLSVELAMADGRLLPASADEQPDLFWAVRGGGGNFGVATAFQFQLRPAGIVLGGATIYPATVKVLREWADFVVQAPDELTSIVFVMPAPPAPFVPEEQVGKLVALIGVMYAGDLTTGNRAIEPLRQLGGSHPIADITAPMPYPGIFQLTAEATLPGLESVRSGFAGALGDSMLESIVEHGTRMPGGIIQLRGLGGAMARVPEDATAFAHRDKPYMVTIIGSAKEPAAFERQRAWTRALWQDLRPGLGGVYVNFLEDEGDSRVREAYTSATYARLAAIKRRYDPTNVFRLNQNIQPTD